jgi:hypothetical protein
LPGSIPPKAFPEGFHRGLLLFFRKAAPGEEKYQALVQDNGLTVYVTGREPRKKILFSLADQEDDLKIVDIEKTEGEAGATDSY